MDDLISRQAAIEAIVAWTVEDRPESKCQQIWLEESSRCHPHSQTSTLQSKSTRHMMMDTKLMNR